ncbi:MAG TPA: hypothetical protein VL986_12180 [Terracidiphilus sp.]|nr:hypothetical protein [Terracidiphilus sp.]
MHSSHISIWFFIGVMLTIYGVLIFGWGVYELAAGITAPVELSGLHAPVWWGGGLTVLGLFYLIRFRPGNVTK